MRLLNSSAAIVVLCWLVAPAYAGPGDQTVQVGAQVGAAAGAQAGAAAGAKAGANTGATVETPRVETPRTDKPAEGGASGPVSAHVAANPALGLRLQPLLPAGMTMDAAARGFRNEGQFIAALHASTNLSIPFDRLKAGVTGSAHDSLGQAIHTLKPTVDARVEAEKAESQARADVEAAAHPTVAQRIEANAALAARLRPLLPEGMTFAAAAAGFSNEGQFIAALHASSNLGIPYGQLWPKVTGTARQTLGQAIHDLKPAVDARAEAQKAEGQARADLQARTNAQAKEGQDRDDR